MQKFKIASSAKKADKDRIDNGDDWETDPDFERNISEIDQRWGSKRTVGSINMSQLIKEVHEDHQLLKDKYGHESQKDHSAGFGGKFGIQKDRQDSSAYAFDHIEKLSKHTSQEMNKSFSTSSKKVISTSEESFERKSCDSNEDETNRAHKETSRSPSGLPPKPTLEPKSSQAIKDRIKAMSSRCDEKLSEKLTNTNKSANTQFTSDFKSERKLEDSYKIASESIRSMSKRFENMCQENQDNFKKLTEERRKEFFNEIKSQVKETRKGYDGFDTPEETPDNIDDSSRDASIPITNKCHNFTRKEVIKTNIVKEGDKIIRESTERNVETSTSQQVPDEIKKSEQNLSSEINNTEEGLKARTLFDYVASDDDEISFDAGEIITNIEKVDEGWYKGTVSKNDKISTGLFPANHVTLLNDPVIGNPAP